MRRVTTPPVSTDRDTGSLRQTQAVLARLCTDGELLAAFERDPAGFAAQQGSHAAEMLASLDMDRLRHFSRSLQWKRAKDAGRLLPLTVLALEGRFFDEFFAYSGRVVPAGTRKPLADAMAFARHLQNADSLERDARQAARFEWMSLAAGFCLTVRGSSPMSCRARRRKGLRVRLAFFDCEFGAIDPAHAATTPWPRRRNLVLFVGVLGWSGVWYWTGASRGV